MKPVIIGTGVAGLTAALSLAPMPVIVLSAGKIGEASSSAWAQGGIAAAMGADDTPTLHAQDTLVAGAGLCNPDVVKTVTDDGPSVIEFLSSKDVAFDRDEVGQLRLGLEAAHSRRRIVHAADKTGAAILDALIIAARATSSIEIVEDVIATDLLTHDKMETSLLPSRLREGQGAGLWRPQSDNPESCVERSEGGPTSCPPSIPPSSGREVFLSSPGKIAGVVVKRNGEISILSTRQVVLATGGAGALWRETSNPLGSWGGGLLLAARAGAALGDLEFMQFHPTAIDIGRDPMPLASEALRGEGCTLVDENGDRFTDELQPRDVVARAIWAQRAARRKVFLDARKALGQNFCKRFPTINNLCLSAGIDPATTPIPVAPAAHYHMGGVMTDMRGRTSIEGLWACGEVACTGLHGANRLASNSLLEAVSFGRRVADDLAGQTQSRARFEVRGSGETTQTLPNKDRPELVRAIMSQHVSVLRDSAGLQQACAMLAPLAQYSGMAMVALMIADAALKREESRGAHTRTDFSETREAWQRHQHVMLADIENIYFPKAIGA